MAGLEISRKGITHRIVLWALFMVLIGMLGLTIYLGTKYYLTGQKPAILPEITKTPLGNPDVDEKKVTKQQVQAHTVPDDEPRYVSIPSLGVKNVRVFNVGLTSKGAVDAPKNINDAAWYNKSAKPGSGSGVVLIDAHNGGATQNGIFSRIAELKNGDTVIVQRGDGKKYTYEIAENRTLSLEETNKTGMKRILTPFDPAKEGLGLITCAGEYVPKDRLFNKRVLVRAVLSGKAT